MWFGVCDAARGAADDGRCKTQNEKMENKKFSNPFDEYCHSRLLLMMDAAKLKMEKRK